MPDKHAHGDFVAPHERSNDRRGRMAMPAWRKPHIDTIAAPGNDAQSTEIGCQTPNPLRILSEEHALQSELCDLLEAIADKLPQRPDGKLAQVALSILEAGFLSHMRLEDDVLFPMLRQRAPQDHRLIAALACLEQEHDRDGAAFIEIIDGLHTLIADRPIRNPDMFGYMLRGFFESQRRHIAWEDSVVMPAARMLLTGDDLRLLQDRMIAGGQPWCSQRSVIASLKVRASGHTCTGCAKSGGKKQPL